MVNRETARQAKNPARKVNAWFAVTLKLLPFVQL
jgi:hypothetical protein